MAKDDFRYDPEQGEKTKKYRLPFALCKAKGIEIKDWWTPSDAWKALEWGGYVNDVSEEYEEYYRKLKKDRAKKYKEEHPERVKEWEARAKTKKQQLASAEHTPDKDYRHESGKISGISKSAPMTFEQADGNRPNPFFGEMNKDTGVNYIGYRTNCATCVATYVARRKGYDLRALPNLNNESIANLSYNVALAYIGENGEPPKKKSKPFNESLGGYLATEVKNGEIHSLQFSWKGTNKGHIIVAERDNGKLRLYDPQTGLEEDLSYLEKKINRGSVKTMNLTNCEMNEEFCDKIMKGGKINEE